jgi:hypothetical protein
MIVFLGLGLVLAMPAVVACVYLAAYVLLWSFAVICRTIARWLDR